ncbi:nucleotidyltransferase domain-containing protein [Halobacillus shinanisalinarum]|uniref:Nucleotidyltransferase domain-containing protein n=1 Tax=Halobacillus shinanisalinarum TaxID=2932258 RepID=A0ABY4GZZ4_9BACI|nr:aminoglycoside 6-adenylyltransferase [Halobacillus shinanisalinarum]UOQ93480.1 nucleotidyltransferase domain-containing protein [Halobacillus shinanisalinarum]
MGFVSRHEERDFKLAKHRDELLHNALNDLIKDPNVLAIYQGGSLAKGNYDHYSDIDLHIIVTPEKKANYIRDKRKRPKKWGSVLFYEGTDDSPIVVTHFDCFVKVDIFYKEPSELQPSLWLQRLRALYDPCGLVEKVLDQSSKLEYHPTTYELEVWRGKVFAFMHETYRAVMRNESFYALSNLDRFRWLIVAGWYMEMGIRVDSPYGVWSKLEGKRSRLNKWQLSLLESWECSRSSHDIMKTMASMVPEFMRLNKKLCKETGLEQREEWCKKIIEMVL